MFYDDGARVRAFDAGRLLCGIRLVRTAHGTATASPPLSIAPHSAHFVAYTRRRCSHHARSCPLLLSRQRTRSRPLRCLPPSPKFQVQTTKFFESQIELYGDSKNAKLHAMLHKYELDHEQVLYSCVDVALHESVGFAAVRRVGVIILRAPVPDPLAADARNGTCGDGETSEEEDSTAEVAADRVGSGRGRVGLAVARG